MNNDTTNTKNPIIMKSKKKIKLSLVRIKSLLTTSESKRKQREIGNDGGYTWVG